eukprot:gene7498-10215_t
MDNSSEKYTEISKITGVDFLALKSKYSKQKQDYEQIIQPTNMNIIDNLSSNQVTKSFVAEIGDKLDQYKICISCNGSGTIKYKYNHMILDKECENCDGEGILIKWNDT